MGARPLRRTIQDYIEDAITDYYLENPSEKIWRLSWPAMERFALKGKSKPANEAEKVTE